jgi:hypothetical protein
MHWVMRPRIPNDRFRIIKRPDSFVCSELRVLSSGAGGIAEVEKSAARPLLGGLTCQAGLSAQSIDLDQSLI